MDDRGARDAKVRENSAKVRESTVEGIFYPARAEALSARVATLLSQAAAEPAEPGGPVYGLITPHASLDYAGDVAAAAYRCVAGSRPAVAVLLGPTHRDAPDAALLPESGAFRTPLGNVPVDRELLAQLRESSGDPARFLWDDIPHLEEHCLEVQLPFLQHLFPSVRIVPVLVGRPSLRLVQVLAQALRQCFGQALAETLFVVTTNLGGQHAQRPPRARSAERGPGPRHARFVRRVLQADWRGIAADGERGRAYSCGAAAIAAILHLHERQGGPVRLLRQGSSAEAGGGSGQTVRYAAFSLARAAE